MSNRLLIFKVPFAVASVGEALGVRWKATQGGCDKSGVRDGGGGEGRLEVPVDNTINLLPRIVKLRWNFKLDILSENLTPCSPPGSYSFPFVSPPLSRARQPAISLFVLSRFIYLSICLSPSLSHPSGLYFIPLFFPLRFLARCARHSREQRFHWTSWLTNRSYLGYIVREFM